MLPYEFAMITQEDYGNFTSPVESKVIGRLKQKTRLRKELPGQIANKEEPHDDWDTLTIVMFTLASTTMVSNVILNLLIGIGLQFLWGMVNALQLMVHMVLINLLYPASIQRVFIIFMQIASFEVIDTSEWYEDNFNLQHSESLNLALEELGYESQNFIINAGLLFLTVVVSLFALLGIAAVFSFRKKNMTARMIYEKAV